MWSSHVDDEVDVLEVEVSCWKCGKGDVSEVAVELGKSVIP
jgi:hypothetical protein